DVEVLERSVTLVADHDDHVGGARSWTVHGVGVALDQRGLVLDDVANEILADAIGHELRVPPALAFDRLAAAERAARVPFQPRPIRKRAEIEAVFRLHPEVGAVEPWLVDVRAVPCEQHAEGSRPAEAGVAL